MLWVNTFIYPCACRKLFISFRHSYFITGGVYQGTVDESAAPHPPRASSTVAARWSRPEDVPKRNETLTTLLRLIARRRPALACGPPFCRIPGRFNNHRNIPLDIVTLRLSRQVLAGPRRRNGRRRTWTWSRRFVRTPESARRKANDTTVTAGQNAFRRGELRILNVPRADGSLSGVVKTDSYFQISSCLRGTNFKYSKFECFVSRHMLYVLVPPIIASSSLDESRSLARSIKTHEV